MTNQDRILRALRASAMPLDDDQLSMQTGIRPRQTINQICRALEQTKVVRRYHGEYGKIVNELVHTVDVDAPVDLAVPSAVKPDEGQEPALVERAADHARPPGISDEQRDAERVMLDLLGEELEVELEPATIKVPSGARVDVDGADADRSVLVECWTHQGRPKAAQRQKVLSDAFKLTWISSTIYPRPRLYLCLSDQEAAAPFLPSARSWAAQAMNDLGITVAVVELPAELRRSIKAAQERQYR
jgi:hypothetical protein